jgi:hypothetical protein
MTLELVSWTYQDAEQAAEGVASILASIHQIAVGEVVTEAVTKLTEAIEELKEGGSGL